MVTDPRTLQANERTLLAWLRTGVSLITLGFAVAKLGQWLREAGRAHGIGMAEIFGGTFVFLGAATELLGLARYQKIRKALLAGAEVPTAGAGVSAIVVIVAVIGFLLGLYVFRFYVGI